MNTQHEECSNYQYLCNRRYTTKREDNNNFIICVGMPTFIRLLTKCNNKPNIKPQKMKTFHNYKLFHSQAHKDLNFIN